MGWAGGLGAAWLHSLWDSAAPQLLRQHCKHPRSCCPLLGFAPQPVFLFHPLVCARSSRGHSHLPSAAIRKIVGAAGSTRAQTARLQRSAPPTPTPVISPTDASGAPTDHSPAPPSDIPSQLGEIAIPAPSTRRRNRQDDSRAYRRGSLGVAGDSTTCNRRRQRHRTTVSHTHASAMRKPRCQTCPVSSQVPTRAR